MTHTARAATQPLAIVLVEDNASDAELIAHAIHAMGNGTVDIVDGEASLSARIAAGPIDVVLCDYRLYNWTAHDAFALVSRAKLDAPFILVTGSLGDERAVECLLQGMDDYVLKGNLARLPMAISRAIEKHRAEAEKRRGLDAIRKLSHAVDQSPASVIITDTRGEIEYVNRRFTEITGYEFAEAVGRSPKIIQSGLTPSEMYRDLWGTITRGETWRAEIQNRRKNGELYWDSVSIAPMRDDAGRITHYIATQQDITARRRAEETNRERDERFRQLVENMQEVFFIADAGYRETVYVNRAYEAIWGRSVESLYADPTSFLEAVPPEDRTRLIDSIRRTRAGGMPESVDFRVVRPDGEVRWVLGSAGAIGDASGRVHRLCGIVLDITDRRRAELALGESEERFRSLIEASFDGITILVDGRIADANAGALRLFGYTREEIIGRPATHVIAPESIEAVAERIMTGAAGTYDFIGVRKDGTRLTVEAIARSHTVGDHVERITALRDVTMQRRSEAQVRQAQKMEAIGSLAGGVAHDFNNLLTVITTYASFIDETFDRRDARRDDVAQIALAANNAATLTRQLLAFSRQQVVQPRVIVLNGVINASGKMLRRLIGEDVSLVTHLAADPVVVRIDPGQIEQIIMNLAVNARDAMPVGGQLTIELSTTTLDAAYADRGVLATAGRYALIAVSDTGVGMDPETQARIFEPFFTTKPVGKGTGLGLATVYGIIKQNDGFIWVYSEPNRGTTFKIYLPLIDDLPDEIDGDVSRGALTGTESILIVEDSPQVRAATRGALERFGYSVIDAPSGAEALSIAKHEHTRIDLLMTDVVMPEMSGRQVADAFAEIRPGTKILFMSGYADDAIVRHGILTIGHAFLQKPFTPETLARTVRRLLDT